MLRRAPLPTPLGYESEPWTMQVRFCSPPLLLYPAGYVDQLSLHLLPLAGNAPLHPRDL